MTDFKYTGQNPAAVKIYDRLIVPIMSQPIRKTPANVSR